jgi:hypothetical protein
MTFDSMLYTAPISGTVNTVNVAEFRQQIEHLERLVNCDWHACANDAERADWAFRARKVGSELIHMACKRATVADMDRRERVLDKSTQRLATL